MCIKFTNRWCFINCGWRVVCYKKFSSFLLCYKENVVKTLKDSGASTRNVIWYSWITRICRVFVLCRNECGRHHHRNLSFIRLNVTTVIINKAYVTISVKKYKMLQRLLLQITLHCCNKTPRESNMHRFATQEYLYMYVPAHNPGIIPRNHNSVKPNAD